MYVRPSLMVSVFLFTLGLHAESSVLVVLSLLSLLGVLQLRIITLLQNYQLLVIITKPNEMVGSYRRDYPLNDYPPPFLSGLSLRIFLAKTVYMGLRTS